MATTDLAGPSKNYVWLILGGTVQHITGTDSVIFSSSKIGYGSTRAHFCTQIDTGDATGLYPLFNCSPNSYATQFTLFVLTEDEELGFVGAANTYIWVDVLEWRI